MWADLRDPGFVEFYRDLGEDWEPMVHAVQYIQAQPWAESLFAVTSLAHFQITTAPSYAEQDGHRFLILTWLPREHSFRLAFDSDPKKNARQCSELELPNAINALVNRLLIEEGRGPNDPDPRELA